MKKTILVLVLALFSAAAVSAQTKYIGMKRAKRIAGEQVTGKIKSSELEKEHGKLIYSFDISTPKSKSITEVQVDAKTGKIVSTQVETPEDQAKESAADKLEKKK